MAGRLLSAIRSAVPERSLPHRSYADSSAATRATAWLRCASAEAWARRESSSGLRSSPVGQTSVCLLLNFAALPEVKRRQAEQVAEESPILLFRAKRGISLRSNVQRK